MDPNVSIKPCVPRVFNWPKSPWSLGLSQEDLKMQKCKSLLENFYIVSTLASFAFQTKFGNVQYC